MMKKIYCDQKELSLKENIEEFQLLNGKNNLFFSRLVNFKSYLELGLKKIIVPLYDLPEREKLDFYEIKKIKYWFGSTEIFELNKNIFQKKQNYFLWNLDFRNSEILEEEIKKMTKLYFRESEDKDFKKVLFILEIDSFDENFLFEKISLFYKVFKKFRLSLKADDLKIVIKVDKEKFNEKKLKNFFFKIYAVLLK